MIDLVPSVMRLCAGNIIILFQGYAFASRCVNVCHHNEAPAKTVKAAKKLVGTVGSFTVLEYVTTQRYRYGICVDTRLFLLISFYKTPKKAIYPTDSSPRNDGFP